MITEFLGPTLEDIFDICGRQFSLKTTCMLFVQMIELLRSIHEHDFIHRDIKPENIFITDDNVVILLDFGVARRIMTSFAGETNVGTSNY